MLLYMYKNNKHVIKNNFSFNLIVTISFIVL